MARVRITVEVPDEIIERVRTESAGMGDFDDWSDALWEVAEEAVIDEIRASFTPADLLEEDGA